MRSILFVFALMLSLHARSQTLSISLPDSLAGKNWVRNLFVDEIKKLGLGEKIPNTIPKLDPCKEGPEIKDISTVSSTNLSFKFHGDGVFEISWLIKNALNEVVQSGVISPQNNTPQIFFNRLSAGNYTLQIYGKSCQSGVSSKAFIIVNQVGVIPPKDSESKLATIAKGYDEHMNLQFVKDGDSYLVTDISNANQIGNDYEYRYMIGSDIIKTGKELLTNYRIGGTQPRRIAKYKVKPNLSLNNWTHNLQEVSGYFSLDAGETFSHNTSVAFETFCLPGEKSDFINPIPAVYNPTTQNVQWGDFAPDIEMPKGHVWIADPRPWGYEKMLNKGITHLSNYSLPWHEGEPYREVSRLKAAGQTYNDVPRIETILKVSKSGNTGEVWPNGVSKDWWPEWGSGKPGYSEGYQMGLRADISDAIFIGEFSENVSWLPADAEIFRGFYDAYMPRMEERFGKKGIPYLVCHDYLLLGMETLDNGKENAYKILSSDQTVFTTGKFSANGSLGKTNMIVETVYLNAIDIQATQPYKLIFKLELFKKMGFNPGVFLFGVHEWRPNNLYETNYLEGKFYLYNKLPLDPSLHIANGFLAQVFGNLFVEWGGNRKVDKKLIPESWANGLWFPNGSNQSSGGFPYFKQPSDEPYYGYSGSVDLSYFSQKLFIDTYGQVDGGKDQYLRYRIDGGNWIEPSSSDFIDAYYAQRGFVHSRTKNDKTAIFYLNCFTDNDTKLLEVQLPDGTIWKGKVAGSAIHAQLI